MRRQTVDSGPRSELTLTLMALGLESHRCCPDCPGEDFHSRGLLATLVIMVAVSWARVQQHSDKRMLESPSQQFQAEGSLNVLPGCSSALSSAPQDC